MCGVFKCSHEGFLIFIVSQVKRVSVISESCCILAGNLQSIMNNLPCTFVRKSEEQLSQELAD